MKITVLSAEKRPAGAALLALPVYEGKQGAVIDRAGKGLLPRALRGIIESRDFTGREKTREILHAADGKPAGRLLLIGLGEKGKVDGETLRRYGGVVAQTALRTAGSRALALLPSAGKGIPGTARSRLVAEGLGMGAYRFGRSQEGPSQDTRRKISSMSLLVPADGSLGGHRDALRRGLHLAGGVNLCREVGNLPGNLLGPVELARRARKEGEAAGLKVRVLDEKAIEKEGMGALLGVARGSARPPRLVILDYSPARRRAVAPLVFVGKAITFDSGGISLKPSEGMQEMKFDMCGGGAVLGALTAIGRLKPPQRVIGIIACAENMPGGAAIRPGDILTSAAGITIEIINTDAEGRLVLADALHLAKRYKPELVVDLATLTGACVVALGAVNSGLFTRDRDLARRVGRAAEAAGEKMWPMPLDEEYFELIRSDVADVKNSGGRKGGAISAAAFLSRFIEGHPWVHLDIAGTASSDKASSYGPKGATGAAVRTLVHLALEP
ncbi:MAG: leucyl aminopeptidase [Planctomycetota bacterium]